MEESRQLLSRLPRKAAGRCCLGLTASSTTRNQTRTHQAEGQGPQNAASSSPPLSAASSAAASALQPLGSQRQGQDFSHSLPKHTALVYAVPARVTHFLLRTRGGRLYNSTDVGSPLGAVQGPAPPRTGLLGPRSRPEGPDTQAPRGVRESTAGLGSWQLVGPCVVCPPLRAENRMLCALTHAVRYQRFGPRDRGGRGAVSILADPIHTLSTCHPSLPHDRKESCQG